MMDEYFKGGGQITLHVAVKQPCIKAVVVGLFSPQDYISYCNSSTFTLYKVRSPIAVGVVIFAFSAALKKVLREWAKKLFFKIAHCAALLHIFN